MADYSCSDATRQRILQACQTLFFSKGYTKTSYEDISLLAEVNQGSITYHFKSKLNLGIHIVKQLVEDIMAQVETLFPDEEEALVHSILNSWIIFYLSSVNKNLQELITIMLKNEKAFFDASAAYTDLDHRIFHTIASGREVFSKEYEDNQMLLSYVISDIGLAVHSYIKDFPEKASFDFIKDFSMQIYFTLYGIEESQREILRARALESFSRLLIELNQNTVTISLIENN